MLRIACAVAFVFLSLRADLGAAENSRVLMVTQSQGFVHGSVNRKGMDRAPAEISMVQLGQSTGLFSVDCTQDAAADMTKENLQKYDIVMFYTTASLPIAEADRDYFFKEWLRAKGYADSDQ